MPQNKKKDALQNSMEVLIRNLRHDLAICEQARKECFERMQEVHNEVKQEKSKLTSVAYCLSTLQTKSELSQAQSALVDEQIHNLQATRDKLVVLEGVSGKYFSTRNTTLSKVFFGGAGLFAFAHHGKHLGRDVLILFRDYGVASLKMAKQAQETYSKNMLSGKPKLDERSWRKRLSDLPGLFRESLRVSTKTVMSNPENLKIAKNLRGRTAVQLALGAYMCDTAYNLKKGAKEYADTFYCKAESWLKK
jgi:hypothetical protein